MVETSTDPPSPLLALIKCKESAENVANHAEMVRDMETVNLCVSVLSTSDDEEMLETSLDALLLLTESPAGLDAVKSASGIKETLNLIRDARRESTDSTLVQKSDKLVVKLNAPEPATKAGKTSPKPSHLPKKKKVLVLHIRGLHVETQKELEDILTKKMKGVHSIIVDVEHQKCTVTVYEQVDAKTIASVISDNTDMEAKLITRNKHNQEILVPLVDNEKILDLDQELPPYLDEKDSPVKEKAVRSAKDIRITASEWFCTAAGFLQRTFYW